MKLLNAMCRSRDVHKNDFKSLNAFDLFRFGANVHFPSGKR